MISSGHDPMLDIDGYGGEGINSGIHNSEILLYISIVDAKITCRFSHRTTIVQWCNRSYKMAIERHSAKRTMGIVRPYRFIKTVCNSYCPFYRYG